MAPRSYAETLEQERLKKAAREEALTQYIRAARAARATQPGGYNRALVAQAIADTSRQDSLRQARRESALAGYIRDARAARAAEAVALARPRLSFGQRVRALAIPSLTSLMRPRPGAQG